MDEASGEPLLWRKSTASAISDCVEVAVTGDLILVRDSKDKDGPVLAFTPGEWSAFLTGVTRGEFALDALREKVA